MKIDLGKVSYDGKWHDFGDARLKIRPYPASRNEVAFKDGAVIFSGAAAWDMFNYCLEAWEAVSDAEGNPIRLTAEVKKQVHDFGLGRATLPDGTEQNLSTFVLSAARRITSEIEEDAKN